MLRKRLQCHVCKDRDKTVILSKCFHIFCRECVEESFKARQRRCPECRYKFSMDDVQPFYMQPMNMCEPCWFLRWPGAFRAFLFFTFLLSFSIATLCLNLIFLIGFLFLGGNFEPTPMQVDLFCGHGFFQIILSPVERAVILIPLSPASSSR